MKTLTCLLLFGYLILGCASAVVAPQIEYREHPSANYFTEKEFTFKFNAPVDEKWRVITIEKNLNIYGIPGQANATVYVSQDGIFEYIGIITANSKIERIGLSAFGIWINFDRFEDTDKFYAWTVEEYLKAFPDERVDEPVDKSHGI